MGSWWNVEVGGRGVPVWGKGYVPDELMLLFTDDDRFLDSAKATAFAEHESRPTGALEESIPSTTWQVGLMGYQTKAGVLRQRLELQGFSRDWVRRLSSAYFDDQDQDGAALTDALTTRAELAVGAGVPPDRLGQPNEHFLFEQWAQLRQAFDDPRFALALSLFRTRASTAVRLDLTALVTGGWLTTDERPHRDARLRVAAAATVDGPVIVITEGSTDAQRLRRSLEIATPEVAYLFKFLDFEHRPPGGTDRVVSLTKGMAAAGVMNRVIAVLDNDTAGREAASQLSRLDLPEQFTVVCLPAVPYADRYPTQGPAGPGTEVVNGRAVSMEFMFGDDVLRDSTGALVPVRWHGFNERVGDYQGRLDASHKGRVGRLIDEALSPGADCAIPDQVMYGCARLAAMLRHAADPPPRIPASDRSTLPEWWRSDPFCELRFGP